MWCKITSMEHMMKENFEQIGKNKCNQPGFVVEVPLGLIDKTDVITEHNPHLCQCSKGKDFVKNYDFVKNFKILYIKEDDFLFSNPNLIFNINEENDIFIKKNNFIAQISGNPVIDKNESIKRLQSVDNSMKNTLMLPDMSKKSSMLRRKT